MKYQYPFGEYVHRLVQQDQTPKKVFVLGVYASAVHARWEKDGKTICNALAVASEPKIFWDGNQEEARSIIDRIRIPGELGRLVPTEKDLNGPSARVLDEDILKPLGFTRDDAWLCDCLPETRLNGNQQRTIAKNYEPLIKKYGLNPVTVPDRPYLFCDDKRAKEITEELKKSQAELLVLLGDVPICQYLRRVCKVPYRYLREYSDMYGYGKATPVIIDGREIHVLPLAHPRQIGALGRSSKKWFDIHHDWEKFCEIC